MSFPYWLCAAAVAAAALAAYIGRAMSPSRRELRHLRREQSAAQRQRNREVTTARQWVAGRFAVHDGEALFYRFLAKHRELYADADKAGA